MANPENVLSIQAFHQCSSLVSIKLNMSNLLLWRSQVLPLVRSLGLIHHLSENRHASEETMGTETKETHDQSIETWSHNDGLLTSWLLGLMTKEVMLLLDGTETAYDVWNSLGEKLLPMTKEKEVQLTNRLRGVKKGTRSLDEYLREFKGICDALAAVRKPVSDLDKVFQLAQGLGTKYMDFRVAMLSKPPYPSYNQFVLALQGHEQMIMIENEENKESINHEQAYFTQRGRGRNRGGRFLSKGRGFTPAGRFNNNATSDQRQNVHSSTRNPRNSFNNQFDYSYQSEEIPQALAAMALHEEEKDPNFYVDSGATAHITNDPEIKKNLLSIGQLTSDNACSIEFSSTGFVIKDQLQQVLARGTKKEGLYALEENVIQAMTVTRSSKASSEVWHQCMGHPQTKSIKLLQDKKFIEVSSWMKSATIPIEMVSFSTSDASCETSKIDHQTKSWKENTANQSSNSKKCSHCPCTTEQRNQFSVEGRISARCNTNQNTEASCVNSTGTPTAVATEISTVAASKNDHNTVVTTETPTDVALGASDHNSHTATTTGTLSQIESTNSYKPAKKNEHVDPSLQNKSTSYSADDEVPDSSKQIVVDISPPQGQHTDNKGTHMITRSKLKNDPSLKSQMEEVFMEQPPGFINEDLPNHVCKLNRSLMALSKLQGPGLIDYPNVFFIWGFVVVKQTRLYLFFAKVSLLFLLLIYVDDIIVTGNDNNIISDLISTLSSEFSLKDLGSLHYFLGLEVKYLPNGLLVSQIKYIRDLLEHTKMMECTPINTPMALKSIITSFDEQPIDPTQYRQLVGSFQYLTFTRPDIVHAVNKACQHFQAPTKADLRAVKRILRYLKGTMEHGIRFFKQSSLRLTGFCDADWAGCTNTRRSTSGNNLAYFLLRDIGIQLREPPQLLCDNLSALHMTVNPIFHARSKHIELDYHFVREKVARGVLITRFLPSSLQVADKFTKALPKTSFQLFRFKLGVHKLPLTSLRGADKGNSTQPAAADNAICLSIAN
ncbi:Retrovirus-related Pol polyprotein from transposon RE1 [Vitis vinifera]|uniref:Retrovirus-related Pol polyprotein from transposon RE1 n=1 Tax=Vitis vinifera TaxID=29760 RepID=A0A438IAM2_VITVI|nr:Retrovirus-related Pol polyprotein from transposon RE1 [Vitis vinifera]